MTDVHEAIRALLLSDTNVTALVGTRIYPVHMPLNAVVPNITIHEISGPEDYVTGHGYPRYQISCWSETFTEATTIKNAVKAGLNRFKGVVYGLNIQNISLLDCEDLYEPESKLYHIPIDFQIVYVPIVTGEVTPSTLMDGGSA